MMEYASDVYIEACGVPSQRSVQTTMRKRGASFTHDGSTLIVDEDAMQVDMRRLKQHKMQHLKQPSVMKANTRLDDVVSLTEE
jgi:hypothetical protein